MWATGYAYLGDVRMRTTFSSLHLLLCRLFVGAGLRDPTQWLLRHQCRRCFVCCHCVTLIISVRPVQDRTQANLRSSKVTKHPDENSAVVVFVKGGPHFLPGLYINLSLVKQAAQMHGFYTLHHERMFLPHHTTLLAWHKIFSPSWTL